MFDNMRKLVLPDPVITAIKDSIIDKLAEGLEGEKRKWVLKFHSDGKFKNELNSALERAVNRFVKEHEDQQFVDAIARNTDFWSLKTVQEAVKQIAVMPSSYLNEGFFMLRQTFIEVAPTVDLARVDAAVYAFLRCVSEEVMNIQQLAPIYQVQLQKISVQTGREMITLLQDANEIQRKGLLALLEAVERQGKFLLSSPTNLKPIDEDNIDSLKSRYFESIEKRYEYMDMGGISPRVTGKAESKIVLVRMEDVFIPLRARGEETVLKFN